MRSLAFASALLFALALPPSADAEPSEKEREAQKLFVEGRDALSRGQHEIACVKFRGSLALFPAANTRANVAQCDEHEGRLVDALAAWKALLPELPEGDPRVPAARARVAALEAKIPQLRITLSADMPADARILVDGAAVARSALESPLLLAVGAHTVVVEAPGRKEERLSITLAEGERAERALSAGALVVVAPPPATTSGPTPSITPPAGPSKGRVAAFISGGVGLASLVAAGVTGGMIVARDDEIQSECREGATPGNKVCTPRGMSLIAEGEPLRIANAVMWGAGLAGLGLGVVLWVVGGKAQPVKAALVPFLSPTSGGMTFTGRF